MTLNTVQQPIRDNYVDAAKGICMLFIMCIHCELFVYTGIAFCFTFFAVPMFFFMSGFYDREMPLVLCLKKYAKRLIVPAIIWILLSRIFFGSIALMNKESIADSLFQHDIFNIGYCTTTWFLIALFWVKVMADILNLLKINVYVQILSSLFIGYVGSQIVLPFYMQDGMIALPFYIMGRLWYSYKIQNKYCWIISIVGLLLYALFCIGTFFYHFSQSEEQQYVPNYLFCTFFVLIVIVLFLQFSKLLSFSNAIRNFGKESLGVMLVQIPLFHICACILHRVFDIGSVLWIVSFSVAYAIVVLVSYLVSVFISRRFPVFLGK